MKETRVREVFVHPVTRQAYLFSLLTAAVRTTPPVLSEVLVPAIPLVPPRLVIHSEELLSVDGLGLDLRNPGGR